MAKSNRKVFPIPHSINWHEGMLLSQHHFQQNDLRNFLVLASQLQLLSSNHFGVRHLRIDTVALSDGVYRIKELEAVFPDGLIFSFFPEKYKGLKPLEVNLKGHMLDDSNEITLYLAIAEISDEVSPVLGNPARFYSIDGEVVTDDNIKDNVARIPRLFPNGFLYAGKSVPEFCIGFPLCKIIKLDGVFHIKNWTPPCFFIERHFPLWKKCESLAEAIREKAVYLSEKLRNLSSGHVSADTMNILKRLVTIIPGLEALVFSNEIRPYELYQELAEVLGSVSMLIPTDIIPVMQPYNHNDIDTCLYNIITLIEHYISVIDKGFSVVQFNRKERFFFRYMSMDELDRVIDNKLYIGIRTDKPRELSEIEMWIDDAVIVSDFALDDVRTKRTKGAKRSLLGQDVVAKILPGSGVVIFEVQLDDRFIKPEQNLHIFNPGGNSRLQPTEIVLYLPRKTGGEK